MQKTPKFKIAAGDSIAAASASKPDKNVVSHAAL
jgi:hypothetical protein